MARALLFFCWFDIRHELGDWVTTLVAIRSDDISVRGIAAFMAVQRGAREEGLRLSQDTIAAAMGIETSGVRDTGVWIAHYAATFACGTPDGSMMRGPRSTS